MIQFVITRLQKRTEPYMYTFNSDYVEGNRIKLDITATLVNPNKVEENIDTFEKLIKPGGYLVPSAYLIGPDTQYMLSMLLGTMNDIERFLNKKASFPDLNLKGIPMTEVDNTIKLLLLRLNKTMEEIKLQTAQTNG